MRNDTDLRLDDFVGGQENLARLLGHHDDSDSELADFIEHLALMLARRGENRVQNYDAGRLDPLEHLHHFVAVAAAVDSVFMLDDRHIAVVHRIYGYDEAGAVSRDKVRRDDRACANQRRRTPDGYVEHSNDAGIRVIGCLLYTSPSPRDGLLSRMPSS